MKSLTAKISLFSHPQYEEWMMDAQWMKWMLKVALRPRERSAERFLLHLSNELSIFLPIQGQWRAKTKQPCLSWSQSHDKNQSYQ